ncbi:MAG: hypothetical protein HOP08_20580 [Cyclobacteriaceae bacterium]|nr:hypothetical protein [Cyclobacteriaceae bacterium]
MKEIHEYEKDIASIRSMMERSEKFISLSGMSGILSGLYALAGVAAAYWILDNVNPVRGLNEGFGVMVQFLTIAAVVLIASISTGLFLSARKAKKTGSSLWNSTTRQMVMHLAVPLVTGGLLILILLYNGYWELVSPISLLFYGLALFNASANTFGEVRYLGFSEIILGLVSALLPGYDLIFWGIGFGVLHVLYGAILYNKYDR